MSHTSENPLPVVEAYHRAWTTGDVDQALTHVSDEVQCYAPDPDINTKDDWRDYLNAFVPMLNGAPEHFRMADADHVALWYFPQTAVTTTTLASELFTVEAGKITEIRLSFDRMGYMPRTEHP